MKKLIIATGNPGKVREIKAILGDSYDEVVSMKEEGISAEIVEDADSFIGNAEKKALAVSLLTTWDVVADDSGLAVNGLDGRPGVYSARYSATGTDEDNNKKLISEVSVLSEDARSAYYACAIVLARQGKVLFRGEGKCYGHIILEPKGIGGFGYDPFFYLPEYQVTFGEMDPAIKNKISHRASALNKLKEFVQSTSSMKKILVVADTHKDTAALLRAVAQAGKIDYLLHLGDHASDMAVLGNMAPVEVLRVRGNCDFGGANLHEEIYILGQKIVLTHGHQERVKYSLSSLDYFAEEKQAEAVLFGHTHSPCIEYSRTGRLLFNPGSLGHPKNGRPTFGLLFVTKNGVSPKIITLGEH